MENRSHALAAGFFVLVLGIAAALALWWLGQTDDKVDTFVLATKKNVTGLNVQATVRYRGIRAGKVETIVTDPDDPRIILVRITVDSRFKLTKGTTAQLGYQGVTGLAYVSLEDDGSSAEVLKGDKANPPRIELKPTLLDMVSEKAGDIVGQIGLVAARLSKLLDEKNAQNFARTLENVAEVSEGMKQLPAVIAAMREAVSPANLQRLQQILAHVEKTAGETTPLAGEARQLVRSMSALSQRVDSLATQTGSEVTESTLPRANALMREMTTNARQLSHILENLENNPQMLIFGRDSVRPGPGEAGFAAPGK